MKQIKESLGEISNNFIKLIDQSSVNIQEASKLIIDFPCCSLTV